MAQPPVAGRVAATMPALPRLQPFALARGAAGVAAKGAGAAGSMATRTALSGLELALASRPAADAVDVVLRSPLVDHAAQELAASGMVERTVNRALASPRLAALATQVANSEGMERVVAQVIDSRLFDASVARVLATDELWRAVDTIAKSPSVTEAIGQQGVGFADQVVGEIGERTRRADVRVDNAARRWLRRTPRPIPEPGTP